MKTIKVIVFTVLVLVVIIGVIGLLGAASNIWLVSSVWSPIYAFFHENLDLNIWLIRAICIVSFYIALFLFTPYIVKYFNPFSWLKLPKWLSFGESRSDFKKSKAFYMLIPFGIAVLFCLIMSTVKGPGFSRDGESRGCKAWNSIDGYYEDVNDCTRQVHPTYGTPIIPITPDNFLLFDMKKVDVNANTVFFDPVKGAPLLYYYETDSSIDFFNSQGRHPQFGSELLPVTEDIVKKVLAFVPTTGITLNETSLRLLVGGKRTIVATVLPSNSTNRDVTWISTTPQVATVSPNGEIIAVSEGATTIEVLVKNNESIRAIVSVNVSKSAPKSSGANAEGGAKQQPEPKGNDWGDWGNW